MARVWACSDCRTSDYTRSKTPPGPRCEICTLAARDRNELCRVFIPDGLEGSGTGGTCVLPPGHHEGHSVRGLR